MGLFLRNIKNKRFSTKTLIPVIFLSLVSIGTYGQEKFYDDWGGSIKFGKRGLQFYTHFSVEGDSLKCTLDIPRQKSMGRPLINYWFRDDSCHFELQSPVGQAYFDGKLDGDTISGSFKQRDIIGEFKLTRGLKYKKQNGPKIPDNPNYKIEEVSFFNDSIKLAGTLTLPKSDRRHPAVIMITGSGASNRDEEIHGFPIFHHIAHNFTKNGIAVLRYDDRGIGGSTGNVSQSTTKDFAGDVQAAFNFLKSRTDINPKEIGLFGHSEGSTVAAIVAADNKDICFIVSMAGPGFPGKVIVKEQVTLLMALDSASAEEIGKVHEFQDLMIKTAISNKGWSKLEKAVAKKTDEDFAKDPIYNSLSPEELKAVKERTVSANMAQYKVPWFRYFLKHDPAEDFKKVSCPVLAVFGSLDLQVPAEANAKAIKDALAINNNPDVTTFTFENANHLFQYAKTGSPSEYPDLRFDFVNGFKNYITQWVFARVF